VATGVIAVAVLLLVAWQAIDALLTVFAGAVGGVALRALKDPVTRWTPLPPGPALALVVLLGLGGLAGISAAIVPTLGEQGRAFFEQLPQLANRLQWSLGRLGVSARVLRELEPSQLFTPDVLFGLFSSAASGVSALVVTLVLAVYLAAEPDLYRRGVLRLVSPRRRGRAAAVLDQLDSTLRWWMLGQCVSMAVLGILTTLGLWILGVPYPLVFGAITALMTFVPIVGPIIAAIPTLAVAVAQGPLTALSVGLFYTGLQSLEGYFITPMVHRRMISLPPVLILAVQMLLFSLVGVLGIILAMPLVACGVVLVQALYVQGVLGDPMREDDPLAEPAE
jgi:predicted PurR-regulated permease PerM